MNNGYAILLYPHEDQVVLFIFCSIVKSLSAGAAEAPTEVTAENQSPNIKEKCGMPLAADSFAPVQREIPIKSVLRCSFPAPDSPSYTSQCV